MVSTFLKPTHPRRKSSDIDITLGKDEDTLSTERRIGIYGGGIDDIDGEDTSETTLLWTGVDAVELV